MHFVLSILNENEAVMSSMLVPETMEQFHMYSISDVGYEDERYPHSFCVEYFILQHDGSYVVDSDPRESGD